MKSEKGLALVVFTLKLVILFLIAGVSTYVLISALNNENKTANITNKTEENISITE